MSAHVEEGPYVLVGVANDDQVLAGNIERLEAARSRQVGGASDAEPVPGEDLRLLRLEQGRVYVVVARKGWQQAARLVGRGHGLPPAPVGFLENTIKPVSDDR